MPAYRVILAATALFFLLALPAHAEDGKPDFAAEKLTGNWNGTRDDLYKKGYSFDAYYRLDTWRNFSGGAGQGNRTLDNLDLKMTVDGGKAFGADGLTALVYFLNNNGGRINDLAGTNMGVDNFETPTRAFKLYEAWVEQSFAAGKASVLVGLHDLNTEFYVTDTSGLFLNSHYGIGTEMAATGANGPSIFPSTGLAARLAVKPSESAYVQAAVFDGVPGNVNHPRGTHIYWGGNDGALLVAEGGVKDETIGHFAVGVWGYTSKQPDQQNTAIKKRSDGVYFLADKSLHKNGDQDISAFGRAGFTAGDAEQYAYSWGAGLVFTGFVPGRKDGQVGVALGSSVNTGKYRNANAPVDKAETSLEVTYKDMVTPWLSIQPDFQYTVNPGTNPAYKNAVTAGVRFGVDF